MEKEKKRNSGAGVKDVMMKPKEAIKEPTIATALQPNSIERPRMNRVLRFHTNVWTPKIQEVVVEEVPVTSRYREKRMPKQGPITGMSICERERKINK